MRLCPACGNSFDDRLRFCPTDATALSGTRSGQETPRMPLGVPEPAAPGRFFLGERLRETPTGTLYEATAADGGAEVLLKHVPSVAFPSPALRDRTQRELRLMVGLQAQGLHPVLGAGTLPDGALYVAMAPLPAGAEPLDERVRSEGFLDPAEARLIALTVGGALARALGRSVLHRCLAPYAVYVDDADEARVLDFGLTEFHEVSWRVVQGPLPFVSPEQAEGRAATEQSLVYSLAALYYYMLIGAPPHGDGEASLLLKRIAGAKVPPPGQRRPGLSPDIDRLVDKALDRSPDRRHAGLAELLDDLEALSDLQPARPASGPTPGWMLPSLDQSEASEVTEQVLEADLLGMAVVEAPSVSLGDVDDEDDDLHGRPTMPLPPRRTTAELSGNGPERPSNG